MLKSFVDYLVKLGENQTITTKEINGETYSTESLHRIAPHVDRPKQITVNGLDSIAKLVRCELDMAENRPVYIRVASPRRVEVFTTLDGYMERDYLYEAECDAPSFSGGWMNQEEAIIKLRSIKTTEILSASGWSRWKDRVPDEYYTQVCHQMLAAGWEFVELLVQIKYTTADGDDRKEVRHYKIERADCLEDIGLVEQSAVHFWSLVTERRRPALKLPPI